MPVLACRAAPCGQYFQLDTVDLAAHEQGGACEVLCPHCGDQTGLFVQLPFFIRALNLEPLCPPTRRAGRLSVGGPQSIPAPHPYPADA